MTARLAAGRARALGLATRGTTNPNRLRRVDRWITGTQAARLRAAPDPLVIDLGYGAHPVTTVELAQRLSALDERIRVLGLEIDPERVRTAAPFADPPRLDFAVGGFELAGRRPALVRAFNVLRQYDLGAVEWAWARMRDQLAAGGLIVEGTCDEIGRRASWIAVDGSGPQTFTLACAVSDIQTPGDLAPRLPKALIHHNVPGQPVYEFLSAFDDAWARSAAQSTFGPRQRWIAAVTLLKAEGVPVVGTKRRWRLGELTVPWETVQPR